MPVIRGHNERDEWQPACAWPDDCMVQWGGHGIVIGKEKSYGTAFFEVFPNDGAGGFIRGEGPTKAEAEVAAFTKYKHQYGCATSGGHRWTRAARQKGFQDRLRNGRQVPKVSTYTNGGGFCLKCGAFQTVFKEIKPLGDWRKPLELMELELIMSGGLRATYELQEGPEAAAKSRRYRKRLELRARRAGISVPDASLPEHAYDPTMNPFKEDAYIRACRVAVAKFYADLKDRPRASNESLDGFFDGMALRRLESALEELAEEEAA